MGGVALRVEPGASGSAQGIETSGMPAWLGPRATPPTQPTTGRTPMFTAFSRWRQRTFTPRNGPAAGITFHMWESDGEEIRGELAINGQKIHLNGRSSLTIAEDQYRYGDELIAQVFVKDGSPVLLERVSDGYARVQVYLGQADLDTADTLTQIAERIREIQARKASS